MEEKDKMNLNDQFLETEGFSDKKYFRDEQILALRGSFSAFLNAWHLKGA